MAPDAEINMSNEQLSVTTEEQRERLHAARNRGGMCAACGRALDDQETVYIERFTVDTRKFVARRGTGRGSEASAPVGIECASPDLLLQTAGQEPERCAGCDRSVFYRAASSRRHRALCSRLCTGRANTAARALGKAEG
jgi:hypothetical protein